MVQNYNAYGHILVFLEIMAPCAISFLHFQMEYQTVEYQSAKCLLLYCMRIPCILSIKIRL